MSQPRSPTPAVHFKTYGCQMNELDSAKMARLLELEGWRVVDDAADADALIINTCSVREKPTHKVVSLLGVYRRIVGPRPGRLTIVAGCYAVQAGRELLDHHPSVNAVVGPDAMGRIGAVLRRAAVERFVDVGSEDEAFVGEPVARSSAAISAFVAIQRGCDHGCSYCIVPRVRGKERYRAPSEVLAESSRLLDAGIREIFLLGQNVNRYRGLEAGGTGAPLPFSALLRQVAALDPTARIRFLTSNPWDLGQDLVDTLGELPNVCPYLHLPVQSGSDRVLERMGRPHTAADYLDLVARLREARPEMALSSDFLLGFPGETEEDVAATIDLVDRAGYAHLFVFAYSPRPGTVAAGWEDDVPQAEKLARVRRVLARQEQHTAAVLAAKVGQVVPVLLDGEAREAGTLIGRAPDYTMVHVDGPPSWIGREVVVHVDEALRHTLRGTAVAGGTAPRGPVR